MPLLSVAGVTPGEQHLLRVWAKLCYPSNCMNALLLAILGKNMCVDCSRTVLVIEFKVPSTAMYSKEGVVCGRIRSIQGYPVLSDWSGKSPYSTGQSPLLDVDMSSTHSKKQARDLQKPATRPVCVRVRIAYELWWPLPRLSSA